MNGRRLRLQKDRYERFRATPRRVPRSARRGGFGVLIVAGFAAVGVALAVGSAACGASIQAVYEGNVRFEHCMALDAQPEVKPQIRRACWHEWIQFYTYGQTRDRVRHAQRRIRQLSGMVVPLEGEGGGAQGLVDPVAPTVAAPGSGGGAATKQPEPEPDAGVEPATPQAQCAEDCEAVRDDCRTPCRTYGCHKSCAMMFRDCVVHCTP